MAELTDVERAERRKGMGASDAGPTFNLSPHSSPWSVWVDKVWGHDLEVTPQMQRGHDLEPIVGAKFTETTGIEHTPGRALIHPDIPWMRSTNDFVAACSGVPIEAKTAMHQYTGEEWPPSGTPDGGPDRYVLQVRQQCEVMGADHGYLVVLFVDTWELRHYRIDVDPEITALLIEGERALWEGYVVPRIPPPVSNPELDWEAMKAIPLDEHLTVELDPETVEYIDTWRSARADRLAAEKIEKDVKAELKARMVSGSTGTIDGVPVVTASEYYRGSTLVRKFELKSPTKKAKS